MSSAALFHEVTLRREDLRLRLGRMPPPARVQHLLRAIEALAINQQVDVGSRAKVRRGIHRVRQGLALEDQHVDPRVTKGVEQMPGLVFATGVEDGSDLLLRLSVLRAPGQRT